MKILITGASGFIGSFIVEDALYRGWETWAGVRPTSSRRYLQDKRINFVNLNLDSEEELMEQLRGKDFDYVVHAAGATKCLHKEDFFRINTEGTKHLVNALLRLKMPIKKFVYLSSLSVFGAIHEQQPYQEITEADTPHPNTAYGMSKLESERFLDSVKDQLPVVILRPTGVYGPRERDYYMLAKSIKRHVDFAAGFKRQDITFLYVSDLVEAVFLALEKGPVGRKYFLSDGKVYQSRTFSDLCWQELGQPFMIRIKSPLWLLRIITFIGEYWGRLTGRMTVLNNDKYNILKQRNWRCDISAARKELGFSPLYDLPMGVNEAINWYLENEWL
ncbi:MAG: NAD-dependent epimerase/dehydratase family protein [Prevotella sp.]|jgi:nucleoside-diphosphate-sugar epimerase